MKQTLLFALLGIFFSFGLSANDTLNPCVRGQAFHIVVLGSSTAAGAGPSSSDSTWVNRYRKYLQKINSANQVTNLAQGGTTTYHIMPDWFTAPLGRPATNPARNVTQAIALNADAIIVNMPSNDAANGFGVAEQLFNFNMIVAVADSAGIPVWVCTTQPRSFGTSQIQLQRDVRDSIFSIYGNKALDFWTTIADSTGIIESLYNSGDGVHLNNAGHRILFKRVQSKNILSALIDTTAIEDHFVYDIIAPGSICGSSNDTLSIFISNRGAASTYDLPIAWRVLDLITQSALIHYDTLYGGVASCTSRKLSTTLNTAAGGHWRISAKLITKNDTALSNDSSSVEISTIGLPVLVAENDTVCKAQVATLFATGGDTTIWYDAQGNLMGYGDSLSISGANQTQTFKASVVRGPFFFKEDLSAATASDVNFPGIMFDLVATDTLIIDSLTLKVQTIGKWEVTAHYRNGSYKGFEGNATAWTLWGKDSVNIAQASSWAQLQFGVKNLLPGDTLGVYLDMQSGSNLEYFRANSETTYADGQLSIISGTGIAHSFGTAYFPRTWSGTVHYHYGYNPMGYCAEDSIISVVVQANQIKLGADTILGFSQSLNLGLGSGFTNIVWSTGDTISQLILDTSLFAGNGPHTIYVQAEDKFGCIASDTILVTFIDDVGLFETPLEEWLKIFPNPTVGEVTLQWKQAQAETLRVYSLSGKMIHQMVLQPGEHRQKLSLDAGVYFVQLAGQHKTAAVKLVVL